MAENPPHVLKNAHITILLTLSQQHMRMVLFDIVFMSVVDEMVVELSDR